MQDEETRGEGAVPEVAACRHHWAIEAPRGATSWGRCKRCGEMREFRNSVGDSYWETASERLDGWARSHLGRPREVEPVLVGVGNAQDE